MTRWLLALYKGAVSPALHALAGCTGACRFQPTCSEYAALALATYGPLRGGWLALYRVLRCQPFSRGGFDPVPGTGFDPTLRDARPASQGDERGRKTGADGLMHLP